MENTLKLTALSRDQLIKLLRQAGCRTITLEVLEADTAAGAPVNPDGTLSLINYAAWLTHETEDGNADQSQ